MDPVAHRTIWYPAINPGQVIAKGLLKNLQQVSKSDVVKYHNSFMEYSLALLLFSSGHRPVTDPFCYRHQVDEVSGIALIDDKATNDSRRLASVYLPDIAKRQLQNYLQHLLYLGSSIKTLKNKQFCDDIDQLLTFDCQQSIPLFFYLSEQGIEPITFQTIEALFKSQGPYPANVNRKYLATSLAENHMPTWMISMVLRHHETSMLANGDYCRESHCELQNIVSNYLDPILSRDGWLIRESEFRSQYANKVSFQYHGYDAKLFGPVVRRTKRELTRQKIKAVLRTFLQDIKLSDDLPETEKEFGAWIEQQTQHLLEKLQEQSLPVKEALLLFKRYMAAYGTELLGVTQKRWSRSFSQESSHWHESDLVRYRDAVSAREFFIEQLTKLAKSNNEISQLDIALLSIVSVSLYSELVSKEQLNNLFRGEFVLNQLAGTFAVSTGSTLLTKKSEVLPIDTLSAGLLYKLTGWKYSGPPPFKRLNVLIGNLGVELRTTSWDECLDFLVHISRSLSVVEAPGILRALGNNRITSTPLDLSVLTRLITRKPIDIDSVLPTSIPVLYERNIQSHVTESAPRVIKNWLNQVHQLMRKDAIDTYIQSKKAQPNNRDVFVNEQLSTKQKRKYLASSLESQQGSDSLPVFGQLLRHWMIRLCRKKSRHGNILEAETVVKYVSQIAKHLHEMADLNVLYLDPEDFEEGYFDAVKGSDLAGMKSLAGRLFDFHHYLVFSWRVPKINWSEIFGYAGINDRSGNVSANLITETEYLSSLEYLLSENRQFDADSQYAAWVTFLGYRFALRWSEAYFLRRKDVVLDEEHIYLRVRKHDERQLKTTGSRRTIKLKEELAPLERDLLRNMKRDYFSQERLHSELLDFLCVDPRTNERLDHAAIRELVNNLLKKASGDPEAHYHHLRHGCATRQWIKRSTMYFSPELSALFNYGQYEGQDELVSSSSISAGILPLLNVGDYLGHSTLATTVHSYIHTVHWMRSDKEKAKLSNVVLAWLLDKQEPAVRKQKQRLSQSNPESDYLFWELAERIEKNLLSTLDCINFEDVGQFNLESGGDYKLTVLHSVLINYSSRDRDLERTSMQLNLPRKRVSEFVQSARQAEAESGYERLRLNPAIKAANPEELNSIVEWRRVDDALRLIESNPELLGQALKATKTWANAYHPSSGDFFFSNYDQAIGFFDFLYSIDVIAKPTGFWMSGGLAREQDRIDQLLALGMHELVRRPGYIRQSRGSIARRQSLIIRIEGMAGTLVRKRQINRMMFILLAKHYLNQISK
jgi:integrase